MTTFDWARVTHEAPRGRLSVRSAGVHRAGHAAE